jgi:hypothetical protein
MKISVPRPLFVDKHSTKKYLKINSNQFKIFIQLIEFHQDVKVQQQSLHVDHKSLTNNLSPLLLMDIEQLEMIHHEFSKN